MAVSKARKAEIKQELADWLTAGGGDQEVENYRQRFPEVSRTTFFRYLKEARIVAGRKEVVETLKTAQDLREAEAEARKALPIPVSADMLMPVTNSGALQVIAEAAQMARRSAERCEHEGNIRNLRGYQQAARLLLNSADTAARVAERLHDIQRIEQMHAAIFEEIRKESPETAGRILKRIQHLQGRYEF
jgi:hypothetical protein